MDRRRGKVETIKQPSENRISEGYIESFITPLCNIYPVTKEQVISDNFVIILFRLLTNVDNSTSMNTSSTNEQLTESEFTVDNNVDNSTSMDTSNELVIESHWTVDNNLLVKSRGDSFHDFFDKVRSVLVLNIDKFKSKNMLDIFLLSNFVSNLLKNNKDHNYDLCYKMLQIYINCKINFTTDGNALAHIIMNTTLYDCNSNSNSNSNVDNQFLLEGNLIDYLGKYDNDYYIIACTLYYYSTEKFVKLNDADMSLLSPSLEGVDFINKCRISDNRNINIYVNLFYGALSRVYSDNIGILNNQLIFFFTEYEQHLTSSEEFKKFLSDFIESIGQKKSINNSFPNIYGRFYGNKSNYNIKNFNDNLNNFKNINKDGCDLLIGEGVCVVDADANKKTSNFNYGITSSSNNNRVILSNTLSNRLDESSEGFSKLQKALQQVNENTSYNNNFNNTNPCIVHFKLADDTYIRSYHIRINRQKEKNNDDSILSKIDEILGSVDYMLLRTGQNIDDEEDDLDPDYLSDNNDDDDDDDESVIYVKETPIKNMTVEEGITTINDEKFVLLDEYKKALYGLLTTGKNIEILEQKQRENRDVGQIQKRKKSISDDIISTTDVEETVPMETTLEESENKEMKSLEEQYKEYVNEYNELKYNTTIIELGFQITEFGELHTLFLLERIINMLLLYYKTKNDITSADEIVRLNSELSYCQRDINSILVKSGIEELVEEIEGSSDRLKIYSKLEDRVSEYSDLKSSQKHYFNKDNLVESIQSNYAILRILKSIIQSLNEYCSLKINLHNNPFVSNKPTEIDTISVNNMSTEANNIIDNSPILKAYVNSGSIEGINSLDSVNSFAVDLINFNYYILAKGFGDIGGPLTTLTIVDNIKKNSSYRIKKNIFTEEDEYEMAPPDTQPNQPLWALKLDNIKYEKCVNPIRVVLDTGDYNAFLNLLLFAKCNSFIFNNVLIVTGATFNGEDNIIAFRTGDNKDVLSSKKNGKLKNEKKYEFMTYLINSIRKSFSVKKIQDDRISPSSPNAAINVNTSAATGLYNITPPNAKTKESDPNNSSATENTVQSLDYSQTSSFPDFENENSMDGIGGRKSRKPKFTRRKNKKSPKRKTIKKRKMPKRKNKTRRNK